MKIGVISDTHGSLKYFNQALNVLGRCDYIIHGGDVLYHGPRNPLPEDYAPKELAQKINSMTNIIFTRGNCDADVDQMVINHPLQSPYTLLLFDKIKILLCHGYKETKDELINLAKGYQVDLLIYGHTHVKELYREQELIVLNPGSTALPKDGIRSVATIDGQSIKLINLETAEVIKEVTLVNIK